MIETTSEYKQTPIGRIPANWEIKKLGDISLGKGVYGINASAVDYKENLPKYLRITDIDDEGYFSTDKLSSVDDENSKDFYLKSGDLIFVRTGSTTGKSYLYNNKDGLLVYAGFLIKFSIDNKKANDYYIWNYTKTTMYYDWVQKFSQRSGQPGLNSNEYSNLLIPLPPLPEQQKIAEVLSIWDKGIQETKSIIKKLEKRNKALASKLFLDNDKKSNQKQMIQIVDRIRNSFIPEENKLYKQIGIRSHAKGLFYKEPVTGKSLGNKSVFWIEPNCFIVNIVFAWERAIGKTTNADVGFIASHRFPMYKPKEAVLNLDYLLYFFKSLKGKYLLELASPGGAGRNKTLGQTEFLKLKIPVPSMEKQNTLVDILDTANKELQQYRQKLGNLETQKKGLMQQLLTGKVRTI